MPKKTVFISLPMHGYTDQEISENIAAAEEEYLRRFSIPQGGVRFLNNLLPFPLGNELFVDFVYIRTIQVGYLGRALKRIAMCDEVFFYGNWKDAKGCRVEHFVCELYGIPAVEV